MVDDGDGCTVGVVPRLEGCRGEGWSGRALREVRLVRIMELS